MARYNALLGCREVIRRDRPVIVSEFSPGLLDGISGVSGEAYLRWLLDLGYDLAVIEPDGSLTPAAGDVGVVMAAYHARMVDHIDIVATPDPLGRSSGWARIREWCGWLPVRRDRR